MVSVVFLACNVQNAEANADGDNLPVADHDAINVAILGDSNAWIGGDNCDKPLGWNTWFKERFKPATCRSFARSGATWTNTSATHRNPADSTAVLSDNNVIYNQVVRLKEACELGYPSPQLILIAAGTNDAWFMQKRPGIFSQSVQEIFANNERYCTEQPVAKVLSLAGSVRYSCELLMQWFPQTQVILLTPPQTVATSYESIRRVSDVIETCAQRMSIGVIRLDRESSIYDVRECQQKQFTSDGTHTNEAGARRNGYYIANRVASMLQY